MQWQGAVGWVQVQEAGAGGWMQGQGQKGGCTGKGKNNFSLPWP